MFNPNAYWVDHHHLLEFKTAEEGMFECEALEHPFFGNTSITRKRDMGDVA